MKFGTLIVIAMVSLCLVITLSVDRFRLTNQLKHDSELLHIASEVLGRGKQALGECINTVQYLNDKNSVFEKNLKP